MFNCNLKPQATRLHLLFKRLKRLKNQNACFRFAFFPNTPPTQKVDTLVPPGNYTSLAQLCCATSQRRLNVVVTSSQVSGSQVSLCLTRNDKSEMMVERRNGVKGQVTEQKRTRFP